MKVAWLTLSDSEYDALYQLGVTWEICPIQGQFGPDETIHAQMVEGIAPLQVGQEAKVTKWVLFWNSTEKMVSILPDNMIGYAKYAEVVHMNKEWLDHMHRSSRAHRVNNFSVNKGICPQPVKEISKHGQQLVEQLGIISVCKH